MMNVEFTFDTTQLPFDRAMYQRLLQDMFAERPDIQQVEVTELPGSQAGLSSITLFLVRPYGVQRDAYNPLVVRIGTRALMERERWNYQAYIAERTGIHLVQQRHSVDIGDVSAIAYDYLHPPTQHARIQTLRDYFERDQSVDLACDAVRSLMLDTLAQGEQSNGWYNDGRPFAHQRPLWFYNTMLPPAFILEDATIVALPSTTISLAEQLVHADRQEGLALLGQTGFLRLADFPAWRIEESKQVGDTVHLRLLLFEHQPQARAVYQPLEPLIARIDVVGPFEILRQVSPPSNVIIEGRVRDTRFGTLEHFVRRLHISPSHNVTGPIHYQDFTLINPLEWYYDLLAHPRALTTSIIHGDFNLSNILFTMIESRQSGVQRLEALTPWLIDFDKTTSGGHTIFDAVKLETEYKVHILPHLLHGWNDYLLLERALHEALIAPSPALPLIKGVPRLLKAYQFIATLRRTVLQQLSKCAIPPTEYYLGLLAYGLTVLKHRNLYDDHWLHRYDRFEHPATAAYISACFAATKLRDLDQVAVRPDSFPSAPNASYEQILRRPLLVGRDFILAAAEQRLFGDQRDSLFAGARVVILYGAIGSGRQAIAESLNIAFQQAGIAVCTWRPKTGEPVTVELLVQHILATLKRLGIAKRTVQSKVAASHLDLPTRAADRQAMRRQIIAAIESPKRTKPVALLLHCDADDPEVHDFITQLAREVVQTPLIVVTSQPITDVDHALILDVLPLTHADVQSLVHREGLPLNEEAIEHLYTASGGVPRLLKHILTVAEQHCQRTGSSLSEAIMEQSTLQPQVQDLFASLAEPTQHLLQLAGILHTYTPTVPIETDLGIMFRTVGPNLTWSIPLGFDEELQRYLRQRNDTLWRLLREEAFSQLQARAALPLLSHHLARFYQQHPQTDITHPPQAYLVARYQALANDWQQAADTLQTLLHNPRHIFTAFCQNIYELVQEIYEHRHTIAVDETVLLELAGTCAAYLGLHQQAVTHYEDLRAILSSSDAAYPRLLVRLLQMYKNQGDVAQVQHIGRTLLRRVGPDQPLYAIGQARMGSTMLLSEPVQAVELLQGAITTLQQTRPAWGAEHAFYEEERILMYDTLAYAYAELIPNHIDQAIDSLQSIRQDAKRLSPTLGARIDNNLGYIYYYVRGQSGDPARASKLFRDALNAREILGDRVGQVRSAQNLANVLVNVATGLKEWDTAEALFQKYGAIARTLHYPDRDLLAANYVDALTLRGKVREAYEIFTLLDQDFDDERDEYTQALLLLNRAKLALVDRDVPTCHTLLVQAIPVIKATELAINRIEWAQLMLQSNIASGTEPDVTATTWITDVQLAHDERAIGAAEWFFARGLLATAQGNYATARDFFADSEAVWQRAKYQHHVAMVEYWHAYCCMKVGDLARARIVVADTQIKLQPFGAIPLAQMLQELLSQL